MDDPAAPTEMQITDQTIIIPRAALVGASQTLQRHLTRQGRAATTEETEAALWAWLIDHLDAEIARAHLLPMQAAHHADFLAQLATAQEHGLAALMIA